MDMKTVVFVGDSITEGAGDDAHGGWTRRLAAGLPAEWQAVHAGVGGNTIVDILQRLDSDVFAHDPELIVLAIGINDSRQYLSEGGRNGVALPDFEAGLASFARRASGTAARVLIVGLNPVDETRTTAFELGMIYANAAAKQYDAALQAFASGQGNEFVPIEASFTANGGAEVLTTDGLHPNPAGHELIAQAVWARLKEMLS